MKLRIFSIERKTDERAGATSEETSIRMISDTDGTIVTICLSGRDAVAIVGDRMELLPLQTP